MKKTNLRILGTVLYLAAVLLSLSACGPKYDPTVTAAPTEATEAPTGGPTEADTDEQTDVRAWVTADPSSFRFTQELVCTNKIPMSLYKDFFDSTAPTACVLPALPQYFVPQGMDYWDEMGWFIVSGYFKPTKYFESSVLFAVDAATGSYVGEWELMNFTGEPHTGHDGGVAVTDRNIYLSTAYTLFRISLDDVRATGGSGKLTIAENIAVPAKASFCNASGGYVFVGDFSLNGNKSYTIVGHEHGSYYAWSVAYKIDDSERGISAEPEFVFSIPESIQGFTMLGDGRLFMTKSYGRTNDSAFYVTEKAPLNGSPACNVTIYGKQIPLYEIGSFNQIKALPMAEGCTCRGDSVFVIFESCAYTYRAESASVSKNPTDKIWEWRVR